MHRPEAKFLNAGSGTGAAVPRLSIPMQNKLHGAKIDVSSVSPTLHFAYSLLSEHGVVTASQLPRSLDFRGSEGVIHNLDN